MRTGSNKEKAMKFVEFMTGAEGRAILEKNGYTTNLE